MIFQVSNEIKERNQSSLESPSNLLRAYTFFQSFKYAQFLLRSFLREQNIREKWLHAHDYKKENFVF